MTPITLGEAARRAALLLAIQEQNTELEVPYCVRFNELIGAMESTL